MNVLCFGSLNIDYTYSVPHFVQRGETLSAAQLRLFPGGKGLNQATALARAGLKVSLAGAIGEDGGFLLDTLQETGVDTRHVDVLPGVRTGHAIIQNDTDGDNCILVYGGANHCTGREQIDRVLKCFGPGDVLTVQNEIRELDYLIGAAADRGMRVALTPAPMNESVSALPLDRLDWLFLNEVEGAALLGYAVECDPLAAAEALRQRFGIGSVVLTLGAEGSAYAGAEGCFRQQAVKAAAVDTTAAGDTFAGFFLSGVLQGLDVPRAMRFASTAAAIAITRPGASSSIPTRAEVLERLKEE